MEITAEMVKDLRQRTGIGMMECKAALAESGGDMDKSIEILRKKGHARAEAKAERKATEGLIGSYLSPDGKLGVLAEVNCESDFVARNSDFQDMAKGIAKHVAVNKPKDEACILDQPYCGDNKITVKDLLAQAVAKIGENIKISRFKMLETGAEGIIGSYVHSNNRLGVLVEVNAESSAAAGKPGLQELAKELAMQIAASRPKYIGRTDVPKDIVDAEKEIIKAQLGDMKKPPEIMEKIVEGKLGKFYEEICLMEQPYIREDKVKIKDFVAQSAAKIGGAVKISRFVRLELGQD